MRATAPLVSATLTSRFLLYRLVGTGVTVTVGGVLSILFGTVKVNGVWVGALFPVSGSTALSVTVTVKGPGAVMVMTLPVMAAPSPATVMRSMPDSSVALTVRLYPCT